MIDRRPSVRDAVLLPVRHSAGNGLRRGDDGELFRAGAAARIGRACQRSSRCRATYGWRTAGRFGPAFFRALTEDGVVDRRDGCRAGQQTIRDRVDWWVPVHLFAATLGPHVLPAQIFAERAEHHLERAGGLQIQYGQLHARTRPGAGRRHPRLAPGHRPQLRGAVADAARGGHSQGDLAQVAQYLRVRSAEGIVRTQLFGVFSPREIAKRRDAATGVRMIPTGSSRSTRALPVALHPSKLDDGAAQGRSGRSLTASWPRGCP